MPREIPPKIPSKMNCPSITSPSNQCVALKKESTYWYYFEIKLLTNSINENSWKKKKKKVLLH